MINHEFFITTRMKLIIEFFQFGKVIWEGYLSLSHLACFSWGAAAVVEAGVDFSIVHFTKSLNSVSPCRDTLKLPIGFGNSLVKKTQPKCFVKRSRTLIGSKILTRRRASN